MAAMPKIGEEIITPDEQVLTADFLAFLKEASATRYPQGTMQRFNQARAAGCVEAEFTVPDGLPAEHRVGLFATPKTYQALIRFANATSTSDRERDIRGMSIKVAGVGGTNLTPDSTEQDFVLFSHPVMLAGTTKEFLALLQANEAGGLRRASYFARHGKAAAIALAAQQNHSCHLDIPYWSATPYRFGEGRAVKYTARPTSPRKSALPSPSKRTDTYLRDAMREHLRATEATFDFYVQFQTNPERMPIEDASVEWRERESPYRRVATIRIPPQAFESDDQTSRCERLSFNPWHCLAEHQPLGGMNRARRAIYTAMAQFRGTPRIR